MLKIFVNTWGNYNENGADGGAWLTLPMNEQDLADKLDEIAARMGDTDPEWAIHDYEWTDGTSFAEVHENDNVFTLNDTCQQADNLDAYELDEIAAAVEAFGYTFAEAMDKQQGGCFIFYPGQDLEEVAAVIAEDYFTKNMPKFLLDYFDYAAFANDLACEGYTETQYGVIAE